MFIFVLNVRYVRYLVIASLSPPDLRGPAGDRVGVPDAGVRAPPSPGRHDPGDLSAPGLHQGLLHRRPHRKTAAPLQHNVIAVMRHNNERRGNIGTHFLAAIEIQITGVYNFCNCCL